jgi:hypothetical protein
VTVFKCESCGQLWPEAWCEKDQIPLTVEVPDGQPPRDGMAAAIARSTAQLNPAAAPAKAPAARQPQAAPQAAPAARPVEAPASPQAAPSARSAQTPASRSTPVPESPPPSPADEPAQASKSIIGLDQFEGMLRAGREAIIICGTGQSGKSEIANAFVKATAIYRGHAEVRTLRSRSKKQYVLGGTNPDEVWFQPAGDRHVFLDPSGEFYRQLSPDYWEQLGIGDITEDYFNFVRSGVEKLAGLVLVFDLTKVAQAADHSMWRQQEEEFNFTLAAIRWLRFDKAARPANLGVTNTIAARAARLPKLDVPVLVFFSKADLLEDEYTYQQPLAFAQANLPRLHGALMTHARWFRYDFCHTMERRGAGDEAVDRPVGVLLPMEWLLDRRRRWLPRLRTTMLGGGR